MIEIKENLFKSYTDAETFARIKSFANLAEMWKGLFAAGCTLCAADIGDA